MPKSVTNAITFSIFELSLLVTALSRYEDMCKLRSELLANGEHQSACERCAYGQDCGEVFITSEDEHAARALSYFLHEVMRNMQ